MRMRVLEPLADSMAKVELVPETQLFRAREAPLEILAIQVIPWRCRAAVVLAQIVYGDDVLVRQVARGARYGKKNALADPDRAVRRQHQLERRDPLETVSRRDRPHPSRLCELFLQL